MDISSPASSDSNDTLFEQSGCTHPIVRANNCTTCGTFATHKVSGIKTHRYYCPCDQSSQRYLKSLRSKTKAQSQPLPLREKFAFSEAVFDFCESIADKFEFGIETLGLGLQLYQLLLNQGSDKTLDYSLKMEFYSSVCLMVAAKAIELDRRIPYFSRYQKYAAKDYSKADYEAAEKEVILAFQFNVQKPTFVTYLNFFLSNGVIFTDEVAESPFAAQKAFLIEEKFREFMLKSLRSGNFVLHEPEKLAALMVHDIRKEFKLQWHSCLQIYSGFKASDFLQEPQILKPICIQTPQTTRIYHGRQNVTTVTSTTSASNYDTCKENQEIRIDKKREGLLSKDRVLIHKASKPAHPLRTVPSYGNLSLNTLSFRRIDNNN